MRLAYQFQGHTVEGQGYETGGGIPCRPNPATTLLFIKRRLYVIDSDVLLFVCSFVCSFVCLSPETRTTDGGGGLSHRPFGQHTTRTDLFAGPVAGVCPISVCCPSHGYFSKNKQDSRIVTLKHYLEVGIADSVAAFRSSSRRPPPGEIFWFQIQILYKYYLTYSYTDRTVKDLLCR